MNESLLGRTGRSYPPGSAADVGAVLEVAVARRFVAESVAESALRLGRGTARMSRVGLLAKHWPQSDGVVDAECAARF
jgi:hypothetical protein